MKIVMHRGNVATWLGALSLTLAVGCGETKNGRQGGVGDQKVRVQKVGTEDATPNEGTQDPGNDPVKPDDQASTDPGTDNSNTPDIQKTFAAAGLRNYDQINATMATVTGVPLTTASVNTLFTQELANSLPTDNDVKAFLGSHQVAVFKLAVQYCEALLTTANLRTAVFGNINFAAAPSTVFNAAGKEAFADAMISKFWGKDLENLPPHGESVAMVTSLIDELLANKNVNAANVTIPVATAACSAVLSASPITMY